LGAGYFLNQSEKSFHLYEAAGRPGGNCITLQRGDFRFDTGAHRFHDKDPEITEMIKILMGEELKLVFAPSAIYSHGSFFDFPLSPLNLMQNLGVKDSFRAATDWLATRWTRHAGDHFESMVVGKYGRLLAERFLLNYSEKLWGLPAGRLSNLISGGRLKGLTLKTFLLEGVFGSRKKTTHLDGAFYYPKSGYGAIVDRLADSSGRGNISLNSKVTGIQHRNNRIESIQINGKEIIPVNRVINTLPLPLFIRMMSPQAPDEILHEASKLRFRDVVLVGMIINKPSLTPFATVYFPDPKYPFTRVYEPRNRSPGMAPPGMTSLVAEVPCAQGEHVTGQNEGQLELQVKSLLSDVGWFTSDQVKETFMLRIPFAYPMLEAGIEEPINRLTEYLNQFQNLILTGRNARFKYAHLHDMLKWGKSAAAEVPGQVT